MIDLLAPSIFIIVTLFLALRAKKYLYAYEHGNLINKKNLGILKYIFKH